MKKALSRGFVVAAGLFAATQHANPDVSKKEYAATSDPRTNKIRKFFARGNCPASQYATDFVLAADQHKLDWRLLPSLSFLETTGGKTQRNNNMFGWSNGNARFPSVRAGIYVVASRLSRARHYRGKSIDEKMKIYSTNETYGRHVRATMRALNAVPAY
ncbi:MAG: glucosaminidase domain-containing protein [Bryobacterales bacterium]|nr:glucosaminidase domain-containing protein [Bryobacterales bacterium]MCZ2155043.1 hypothetical protein [Bryobacterales bacterium]